MPSIDEGGAFAKPVADTLREDRAMRMAAAGVSYREIADTLGFTNGADAAYAVQRALANLPRNTAEEHVQLSAVRHDHVTRYLMGVLASFHPVVNNGKVMQDPVTGALIDDPMPKLAAAKLLIQVDERRARLLGLDQPKTTIAISIDDTEREIRKLEAELAKNTGANVNPNNDREETDARYRREMKAIEAARDDAAGPGFR